MPSTASSGRRWDGTPNRPHRQRTLRVAHDSPTRLLRSAQSSRCHDCGNRIDWYTRPDNRPVSLHPHELDATTVPVASRWHVSSGIAHPADDGTPWCRIPHLTLCPARTAPTPLTPQIAALRRHLALHTRRLLDTGTLTPPTPDTASPATAPEPCRPARPIVLLLHTRYLAAHPIDTIQCVAQTRRRHRCTHPILSPSAPPGTWTLVPVTIGRSQLAIPDGLMAVYDLTHLSYAEQLRWRHQPCPAHAAASGAADLALCDWEPFDPLLHHQHSVAVVALAGAVTIRASAPASAAVPRAAYVRKEWLFAVHRFAWQSARACTGGRCRRARRVDTRRTPPRRHPLQRHRARERDVCGRTSEHPTSTCSGPQRRSAGRAGELEAWES